jgi:RNA 2',3'-cyclic 3'-phosphodiesterase
MRLFVAIELPGEIKRQLEGMATGIPGSRWVPAAQLHLTLAFLGEVDDDALKQLTGALAAIRAPGFTLRFSATGCFPDRRRPRVLWAGLEPEPELDGLAFLVREAVKACAIPLEDRPFLPHVTLARLKFSPPRKVEAFLACHGKLGLPPVDVLEFILFQSRLTQQGAIHTPIRVFAISAEGAPDEARL